MTLTFHWKNLLCLNTDCEISEDPCLGKLVAPLACFRVSFKIISVRAGNKIPRCGFLGTIVQLTHVFSDDIIEAQASEVIVTRLKAL